MSVFIDRKYLLQISPKLSRFSQKKDDLYNFRCPICGDSQKNKTKCRGYVFRKKNDYFYMCHNCGASLTFYQFLEKVDSDLIKQYALERYSSGETGTHNYKKPTFDEFKIKPVFKTKTKINLESIDSLPDSHFAKEYCKNRLIPADKLKNLYYTSDFKKFVSDIGVEKENLIENDHRLVIPFYDKHNQLVAVSGRALEASSYKLRYVTLRTNDSDDKLIYGMDRVNLNDTVYLVEGPLDSLFLKNCVASGDANLSLTAKNISAKKLVLIFDNEPRNKEVCKMIENAIKSNHYVVIWPDNIEGKDINEMVLNGFSTGEIQEIIDSNTFYGLEAIAKFTFWKKL